MRKPHIDLEHNRVRTTLWVIASAGAALLTIGAIFFTTSIYQLVDAVRATQVTNTERSKLDRQRDERTAATAADASRSADRIEDCTTPDRPCFEESQQRLAETVGNINDNAVAAAYCADQAGEQTIVELVACIRATLREAQKRQPQENR